MDSGAKIIFKRSHLGQYLANSIIHGVPAPARDASPIAVKRLKNMAVSGSSLRGIGAGSY